MKTSYSSPRILRSFRGLLFATVLGTVSASAQPFGQWDFNASNLVATVGADLQYADGPGGMTESGTAFGTTDSFGLPPINGTNAIVMRYTAATGGMGFNMPTPADADPFDGLVNNYTIIFDLLFPATSDGLLRPLVETDSDLIVGGAGADLVVGVGNGVGVTGGSFDGTITTNTWYRIGFVVQGDVVRTYINGAQVGQQTAAAGRMALFASYTTLILANTGANPAAGGYVNSIQIRAEALDSRQMQSLGGPSADGIPQVIPPVPSFISKWIPAGPSASRDSEIGVVIDDGDTTIADSSISLRLDGVALSSAAITRAGDLITVKTNVGLLALGEHVVEVTYTDSKVGAQTYSNVFNAVLFFEGFDELPLGPNVNEGMPTVYPNVWTKTPPAGWTIDDSGMPGVGEDDQDGMTEWAGWSFASKDFWGVVTDDQGRQQFTKGKKVVAVADPDEWDDRAHAVGYFNSFMTTRPISLVGVPANSAFLKFDSSWDYEAYDDCDGTKWPACPATNNQTATITVSYNGGAQIEVLKWDSDGGSNGSYNPSPAVSPTFHDTAYNESVTVQLNNPPGATNVVITFGLTLGGNDWWWAVDNILVNAGQKPPTITSAPKLTTVTEGDYVELTVVATGEGLRYQWFKGDAATRQPITGATSSRLIFPKVALADDGLYSVRVWNTGGEEFTTPVRMIVLERFGGQITDGLVVHLKFDGDANDSSGRANNGTAVGTVSYVPGRLGQALRYSSNKDGSSFNYVTLGAPADLNFGQSTDFSVSFWTKFTTWSGDPAFLSNKNWNSGGNAGWVVATAGDARVQWNIAPSRADYDSPGGVLGGGNWHHVVVTFARNGNITTFVDGVKIDERPHGAVRNVDTPAGLATNIGQDGTGTYTDGGSVGIEDGTIDDVGIWRRAITADEAKAIYRAGLQGFDLTAAQTAPPVGQDLVAYLAFEDNLNDASGRANNGTAVGSVPFVEGVIGKAMQFASQKDGSSFNYVTLGRPADLNFGTTNSFSVAFWARLESWEGDPAFLANKNWNSGNNPGWVVATGGDGRIQWNIAGSATGGAGSRRDYDSPGGIFNDHNWHHIVVVFKRVPGAGVATTFVDGVQVDSRNYSGVDNNVDTPASQATNLGQDGVGTYTDGNSVGGVGALDEVLIWRRALSAVEAAGLYAAGVLGLPANQATPELVVQLPPGRIKPAATPGGLHLKWDARAGVRLQSTPALSPPNWQDVPGTLGLDSYTAPVGSNSEYFRLFRP